MTPAPRLVRAWLWGVVALILAMTLVGGTTRLTGSGLSMVEWRPLMGALPPMSEAQWLDLFRKYQQTPQYQLVNSWMTLADFERIFFWEYLHRLLGRFIGLAVALPLLGFWLTGRLNGALARRGVGLLVLGGLQGLLGWFMVKSGLVDVPEVSHLRLAAHLLLAFAIAQATVWVALDAGRDGPPERGARRFLGFIAGVAALVVAQIGWGAFMAGLRAGTYAATFPDLNGVYAPWRLVGSGGYLHDMVFEVPLVHWTHRVLGTAALLAVWGLAAALRCHQALRAPALTAAVLVTLQYALGVATVMSHVAIPVAVAHQAGAYALLCCLTWAAHRAWWGR